MTDRIPPTDSPELAPPIAVCPEQCVGVVVEPAPLPDELANTGALDGASAGLSALMVFAVGLAMLGRKPNDSGTEA